MILPPGVISSTRPGSLKPATRTLPLGSSCASDGYVVGVRTEETVCPPALLRSPQPPISVTSTPPSARGVSPFGELSERGGSCPHDPACPTPRTIRPRRSIHTTRQF